MNPPYERYKSQQQTAISGPRGAEDLGTSLWPLSPRNPIHPYSGLQPVCDIDVSSTTPSRWLSQGDRSDYRILPQCSEIGTPVR